MDGDMARFLVIGAAGHAQEVAWSLREQCAALGKACELMFFDDRVPTGELASGLGAVKGDLDAVAHHVDEGAHLVLGIGLPRTKAAVTGRLAALAPWATVIHPTALIGPSVSIGEGSYVGAGAVLTVNARVGRFVTINLHALVTHDDVIGDFATLHPNVRLSGGVAVGNGCELGTGAIAIPGTRIGEWAILGAGSVAIRSLAGHATYVGVPARELSHVP
jgi:acetyltransferase EpsM